MQTLNDLIKKLSHDYLLLTLGALLFLTIKAVLGYITYRHYNKRLEKIESKIDDLRSR
jgi:hypothetical protein